ncbi:MAG: serine hydrolase domain-containing protein [Pseudomonadota bacterium]
MQIKSTLLAGAALALAACVQMPASDAPQPDRLVVDAAIEETVARGAFPFLYVRVENLDGDLVYEHSAANPDFAPEAPTGETWLRLWSMSKSVTIATLLSLEEDGVLSRTDPVTDYLPEFANLKVLSDSSEPGACSENLRAPRRDLTIEDLLNHNDGFYYPYTAYDCLNAALNAARLPEAVSSDDLIGRISDLPLHPDGLGAHHYGIGTTVLALVAERAAGAPFDALVEAHITGPLGITDTLSYVLPDGEPTYPRTTGSSGTLELAEAGDLEIFGGPVPHNGSDLNIYLGGEGMVGTTKAYATFLRLMGRHGTLNGVQVLTPATVRDWYAPKTQLDSAYGKNGFNIWVTSGLVDNLPDQKPGLLVGGGYEGTAFWIDLDAGYVGLIMSQVHSPPTGGVDEVSRIRGLLYEHYLEPGLTY